jgi:hypothetical protein
MKELADREVPFSPLRLAMKRRFLSPCYPPLTRVLSGFWHIATGRHAQANVGTGSTGPKAWNA